ncbi:MAG TPA: deaminase [Planctomycetaceae bacterium]|jgi:tRNA(Arg) A34 adenosine deaminase TadA|nr:deaminase [Planctomycetaceae bacterium]
MAESPRCDINDIPLPNTRRLSNLDGYLNGPVRDLIAEPTVPIPPEVAERHRIYALLLMAIARWYWNPNKRGRLGVYPLNPSLAAGDIGNYLDKDYLGHNIGGLAVDADGRIIDFDFNHNEIFDSSAEHAEARLVRRVFSLVQVEDTWNVNAARIPLRRGSLMPDVTIYTTLESCSQCSGVMALAAVKQVVYLQRDPGMFHIGNILWRLTEKTDLQAPLPISGDRIGLPFFRMLNDRYDAFADQQKSGKGSPFFCPPHSHEEYSPSVTSFLCTNSAYSVFKDGESAFDALSKQPLKYAGYKPSPTNLTNAKCLEEAVRFRCYATSKGRRGTPHK